MTWAPGLNISADDIGRNYEGARKVRAAKVKAAPIFTEQRAQDRWEALRPEDRARIRAEAKVAARAALERFEVAVKVAEQHWLISPLVEHARPPEGGPGD